MPPDDVNAMRDLLAASETLPDPLPGDPFPLVKAWYDLAQARAGQPNPNAMTLATVDAEGRPGARIVLCRGLNTERGYLVFFTNYQSRKGRDLESHPNAALLFHWDVLERQIRVEGPIVKSPPAESDAYFASRSWPSRLGAWASDQSRPLRSREELAERVQRVAKDLGLRWSDLVDQGDAVTIPRPPHWGGYRVWARNVELWLGSRARLHDRAQWTRELAPTADSYSAGPWSSTRLMP